MNVIRATHLVGKKIFVGLSGGVDSAVSAFLLQRAGAEVVGVFMKNFSAEILLNGERTACWVPEWRDANRVAAHLRIPLVKFDFEEIYTRDVLAYLYREYEAGRTPNPDVLCNSAVKFGPFLAECLARGADFIATGHYARVRRKDADEEFLQRGLFERQRVPQQENSSSVSLLRAADENKDQTYFLHQVTRTALARTLFPIGDLTKPEVRALAAAAGLPVAHKKDSTGICFVGDVAIKDFLRDKIKATAGDIVTRAGAVVGRHDGLPWYTIGQRHGFGGGGAGLTAVAGGRPWYVVGKDVATNTITVAPEFDAALFTREIVMADAHWINEPPPDAGGLPMEKLFVRFRHRQPLQEITALTPLGAGRYKIVTHELQRAITPGQFAVIYSVTECFGGGVIE